jgi:hypothetical protein
MITLNVAAPQGHQGSVGSDLKEISKWKMSSAANAEDTNPANGYFKYYQQGSSLQLAINVVNNNSHEVKDLLINFKALLETEDLVVSLTQIDDNTKYRIATISSISSAYSTGSGYAVLVNANVVASGGSFGSGKDCLISFDSKGDQGFQGFQGTRGHEGTKGVQGYQGNRGFQGSLIGEQGHQGYQGTLGVQGYQGVVGAIGDQGNQGHQGYQGVLGPQGTQGDPGAQGPQGNYGGVQGAQGTQGVQGYQGDPGYPGFRGVVGARGFQGPNQGYQGHQGNPGTTGNQGFQGVAGPQGSVGAQGLQGVQGARGYQGVQGSQGDQGPQGVQGLAGFAGSNGLQGAQGFAGNAGDQGPQGPQGVIGSQGTVGEAGLQGIEVTGPEGAQGYIGVQGIQGFQGNAGFQGVQGARGGTQGAQGTQGAMGDNEALYLEAGDSTVRLLLHFDGANNSTTFKDNSYNVFSNATYSGAAAISTTQSKFGGSSLYLNGANASSFKFVNTSNGINFTTGDFTIEMWFYRVASVAWISLINFNTSAWYQGPVILINNVGQLYLENSYGGSNKWTLNTGWVPPLNQWHHIAVVGTADQHVKFYVNGTLYATRNGSYTFSMPSGGDIYLGNSSFFPSGIAGDTGVRTLNGYIDEVRISNVARYSGNFTPSATAFTNADGTAELPANPTVGKIVHSSDGVYACSSASPVIWKKYPIVPSTFSKTTGEVIKASNLPPRWTATDAFDFLSWRLNESLGSTSFASSLNAGASSNLTIAETTNFRAGVDDGLFQKTVTFAGNAASVGRFLTGGAAYPPTSNKSFSMSHWMIPYSNSPFGGADPITFGKLFYANSAWANPIVGLFIALNGTSWHIYANVEGTGTYTIPASSSIPLTLNVPVLVAVTFDGYYLRLYQNGILAGTSANLNNKQIVMGDGPWFAGKAPVGFPGHSFDGQIWDIRVANTVRSAAYYRTMYLDGTGTVE